MDLRRRQGAIATRQLRKDLEELRLVLYNLLANYYDQRDNPSKYPDAPASKTALRREMTRAIKSHYYNAFKLGLQGAGLKHAMNFTEIRLTQEERAWVESAWQHEARYFARFFDDIVRDKSRTNVYRRIDMYVDTINSIYHAGVVRATPVDTIWHWILHPAEHCDGCKLLAKYSPYTKFTLPTTPKAGATQCLSNCKCLLRPVRARPGEVERVAKRNLANSTMLKRLAKLKNMR